MVCTLVASALADEPEQTEAQSEAAKLNGPYIELDPPTVVFDNLYAGENGEAVVQIRNVGTKTLVIDKVHASCGCTGAVLGDREVEPGHSSELKVTFRTDDRSAGRTTRKNVTIYSNDPRHDGQYRFDVVATVKAGIIVTPNPLSWGQVTPGDPLKATVRLKSEEGKPFKILRATSTNENMVLRYEPNVAALEQNIYVEFVPEETERGARSQIVVETDHPVRKRIQIPTYWRVAQPVTVQPAYLPLGQLNPGALVQRSISIQSRLNQPLNDLKFHVEGAPIAVQAVRSMSRPDAWDLTFRIPEELAGEEVKAQLVIDTNVERVPEVKVAIRAQVSSDIELMPELP
jgi:hypothetical protein